MMAMELDQPVIINYKGGYNHDYDTFDDITDRDDNY
jgi:hypothetical protein